MLVLLNKRAKSFRIDKSWFNYPTKEMMMMIKVWSDMEYHQTMSRDLIKDKSGPGPLLRCCWCCWSPIIAHHRCCQPPLHSLIIGIMGTGRCHCRQSGLQVDQGISSATKFKLLKRYSMVSIKIRRLDPILNLKSLIKSRPALKNVKPKDLSLISFN